MSALGESILRLPIQSNMWLGHITVLGRVRLSLVYSKVASVFFNDSLKVFPNVCGFVRVE